MKQGFYYIGVTICFYCYNKKGKLLLQKRSKNCRDEQGRWDCGGGAVRFAFYVFNSFRICEESWNSSLNSKILTSACREEEEEV